MLRLVLIWMGIIIAIGSSLPSAAAIFDRQGRRLSEHRFNYKSINWQLLEANTTYSGIGLIRIQGSSTCTGFFIKSSDSHQAPAYVITNAHCIDLLGNLPSPTEIIVDRPLPQIFRRSDPALTFTPDYFAVPQAARQSHLVKRVVYATMKNSDIALLELSISQKALMEKGITPLTIADQPSQFGEKIEVVGVPGSSITAERRFLHRSTCIMGPTVQVKEGNYLWTQALRHRCSIVNGMSGSPMLANGQVVGLVNTGGTEPATADEACTLDNPCEKQSSDHPLPNTGANYGQLLDRFPSCFDSQGIFNLTQPSCLLEKPQ